MGVDTAHFAAGARSEAPGPLRMTTVSRLNFVKGHRHALAAMRLALDAGSDVRFTIAGEGPARKDIEADIERLGLGDRVVLTGTLSEEEVKKLLIDSDVFILPSIGLGEASPVAVKEAMACGLPVICSIIGGTPDLITSGVDGILVKQGDEPAIAAALVHLATDIDARRRIGVAARERAVREFDTSQTARALLDCIMKSASDEKTGRP
jgi:glycosyltransferase involved in cell wall biosynthesis